jgi:hypothetical protein
MICHVAEPRALSHRGPMPAREDIPRSVAKRYAPPPKQVKRWRRRRIYDSWVSELLHSLQREQAECAADVTRAARKQSWLLPYRPQFRRVKASHSAVIRLYLLNCPDVMRPIAIWLLGRCATVNQHFDLFEFALDASPPARRHAARALRRVEAWERVARLADASPGDPKIAWYASTPTTKRDFRERLRSFAEHVDSSRAAEAAGPSRMALWFADIDWFRRPPKPVEYIRQILERIHRWVHGGE